MWVLLGVLAFKPVRVVRFADFQKGTISFVGWLSVVRKNFALSKTEKGNMRNLVLFLLLHIFSFPIAYAQKVYTYTGSSFTRVSSPYEATMRVTGSFTVIDELDYTGNKAGRIQPLEYDFTDGVQNFDETNSDIELFIGVGISGDITYWWLEVGDYPRTTDTDLSTRGKITTKSAYNDAVLYRPCDEEYANQNGTCKELIINASGDNGDQSRSWAASGPGLPDGVNTILSYEGLQFSDFLATENGPQYTTSDRIEGTVVIKGAITPGASYSDLTQQASSNTDIVAFSFKDGINDFDENDDVHNCGAGNENRVRLTFDENGAVDFWSVCLSTQSIDNSYKQEEGVIQSRVSPLGDTVSYRFCNEYDPVTDDCKLGERHIARANTPYSTEGNWTITPPSQVVELCDNGIDDDGDGKVDADDPDCIGAAEELLVRCMHTPLWPAEGETVTFSAESLDQDGSAVVSDSLEIYTTDTQSPQAVVASQSSIAAEDIASGRSLKYGCRAEKAGVVTFSGWRVVDVGVPEFDEYQAVPVIYNGPTENKLDIVFIPELNRHGDGSAGWELFQADIYEVIKEGIYSIPWFLRNQRDINFWLGRTFGTVTPKDSKDSSKKCKKDKPDGFSDGYSFADAGGIIHGQACRDNASFKIFTTRFRSSKLVVVSHEIGHAAFSLSDEYVGIDTLYFTLPDYPNLLGGENSCRNAAEKRGFNPDNCRNLKADGASGVFLGADWIFEPNFRNDAEPWNEVRDLMQQTGGEGPCTSPTTGEDILCKDRYKVGISEIYRMNWKMDKCRAGRC